MMSGSSSVSSSLPSPALVSLLALAGAGLVVAFLAGAQLPLISSDRRAFAALVILGWILCSIAVGPTTQALGWSHPAVLGAIALGVAALALIGLVALDRTQVLATAAGWIGVEASGNRIAFLLFAAILLAKVTLGVAARAGR